MTNTPAGVFDGNGFATWIPCNEPGPVRSLEAAETILRMHHQCSSVRCRARQSGLRFIEAANSGEDL